MQSFHNESTQRLYKAISLLQTPEECAAFFDDVCTIREVLDMAQRLDAAMLLDKGENYRKIAEEIGISTATISRVSRCMNYGSGGYKLATQRLKENEDK